MTQIGAVPTFSFKAPALISALRTQNRRNVFRREADELIRKHLDSSFDIAFGDDLSTQSPKTKRRLLFSEKKHEAEHFLRPEVGAVSDAAASPHDLS